MWKRRRCQAGATNRCRPLRSRNVRFFHDAFFAPEGQTVDLVQTGLFWNGRRCVFVERAPVAREIELLVDINVLILEDLRRIVR